MSLIPLRQKPDRSLYALVAVNCLPILGLVFFNWQAIDIMLVYWTESAVIGFYNILKMFKTDRLVSLGMVPFFLVHYGMFMSGHLSFILIMFGGIGQVRNANLTGYLAGSQSVIWFLLSFISFFISHGISYYENFLGKQEYQKLRITDIMFQPYVRIIVMHLTILFGGFISLALNNSSLVIFVFVLLKIWLDVGAHNKVHTLKKQPLKAGLGFFNNVSGRKKSS